MADDLTPREREIGEQVAAAASPVLARFWVNEMLKIEEATTDAGARWELLKHALTLVSRTS